MEPITTASTVRPNRSGPFSGRRNHSGRLSGGGKAAFQFQFSAPRGFPHGLDGQCKAMRDISNSGLLLVLVYADGQVDAMPRPIRFGRWDGRLANLDPINFGSRDQRVEGVALIRQPEPGATKITPVASAGLDDAVRVGEQAYFPTGSILVEIAIGYAAADQQVAPRTRKARRKAAAAFYKEWRKQ